MEVKLLSGALGAEVRGINLKNSSKENWEVINKLMLEHKVIFFRNQDITCEEQINLAKTVDGVALSKAPRHRIESTMPTANGRDQKPTIRPTGPTKNMAILLSIRSLAIAFS